MVQYIAYIGPKPFKRIQDDAKVWHEFQQGVTMDALAMGFSDDRIKWMLKSGVFQLRSGEPEPSPPKQVEPSPLGEVDARTCPKCGRVAKTKAGLMSHMRFCQK
jgi:hypothetical protein